MVVVAGSPDERHETVETLGAIGLLIVMFAIAAVLLTGVDRVRRWLTSVPPEEMKRRAAEFSGRLSSPRWGDLERHFDAPAPKDLRALYASALIHSESLTVANPTADDPERDDQIARFLPADLQSVEEASWVVKTRAFPFAEDGMGNYYTVPFHAEATAPSPVSLHWHDGGDVELIANSLADFLSRARRAL